MDLVPAAAPDWLRLITSLGCLAWLAFELSVLTVGIVQIFRHFSTAPEPPLSSRMPPDQLPHITIIRPVKGLEPELYACLASSFQQDYPRARLSVRLCVADRTDPALPLLHRLVADFPGFDARVLVQADDDGAAAVRLGPNPKIRNVSLAFRDAGPDDLIWLVDCNVWVARHVAARLVDKLCGFDGHPPYKLVHMVPIVVDLPLPPTAPATSPISLLSCLTSPMFRAWRLGGGRLDEMFMSVHHASYYTAVNTLNIVPCVLGKSTMFRKSHLELSTTHLPDRHRPASTPAVPAVKAPSRLTGIDYFSSFICEDHMIGGALWRLHLPGYRKHGLLLGDVAIQPVRAMSVQAFAARRIRWCRARKWTELLATWVEPGIDTFLSGLYFAYAFTTTPGFDTWLRIPSTWTAFAGLWIAYVLGFALVDWAIYRQIHALPSGRSDPDAPEFARGGFGSGRPPAEWLAAWLAREFLALPIWSCAFFLPTVIVWKGKRFTIAADLTARELH